MCVRGRRKEREEREGEREEREGEREEREGGRDGAFGGGWNQIQRDRARDNNCSYNSGVSFEI